MVSGPSGALRKKYFLATTAKKAESSLGELRTRLQGLETNTSERELALQEKRIVLTESERAVAQGAESLYGLRSDIKALEGQIDLGRRESEGLEQSNQGRRDELEQLAQQRLVAQREAEQARVSCVSRCRVGRARDASLPKGTCSPRACP